MPTLTPPSFSSFVGVRFGLIANTQVFSSPLTRVTQVVERSGKSWAGTVTLPRRKRADAVDWQVFMAQLRGASGTFYFTDPRAATPRGAATGTPLVNGASQTGTSLATDGWTVSVTNILRKGDYVSVDLTSTREMYILTADANSNSSGQATLSIEPPIRTSPANDATVRVSPATFVARLVDDNQTMFDVDSLALRGLTFSFVEALGI